MPSTGSEEAVRSYLVYLSDPGSLVNTAEVARLEAELANTADPIDRLMVMAALHKAKTADPDAVRKGFVANAKVWADSEGVAASAFEQMGVPRDVLQQAGIIKTNRRSAPKGSGKSGPAPRKRAVRSDELEGAILAIHGPFTAKDISEQAGGSPITVRATLERLAAAGRIVPAGERRGERGRASKVWTVADQPG